MKSNRLILLAGAAIVLAAFAAYSNSFQVPFTFDDLPSILDNPSIRRLSTSLAPPQGFGVTVSGRPLLNLTLAVNYAISGTEVWSYHVVNLVIHSLAGLTLFGLVRRTLLLGGSREQVRSRQRQPALRGAPDSEPAGQRAGGLLRENALPVALVTALLWTLHPLQTESVTYVIQRAESLMGLFYLLTLYCFVRSVDAPHAARWQLAAIVACLLGTGCKEVIVTAPVVVLLYDRTFVAGSFRAAWRSRRWLYGGLMATWLPLVWLVLGTGGDRGGTFNFTAGAFASYWLTQFEAIIRYLGLSLWPEPLVFEYGFFKVEPRSAMLPYALAVAALLGATGWAWWKKPAVGFPGACFFLILAPTCLVPGLQVIVEHRMYLPLAAVLALVVGAGTIGLGRRGLLLFLALAVAAGWLTVRRNADYETDMTLWRDTVEKRPASARAQGSLGAAYYNRGNLPEALRHYEKSLRLDPSYAQIHYNMGLALVGMGRTEEAIPYYAEAVRILPYFAQAHAGMAAALVHVGRGAEALEHLQVALKYLPRLPEAHYTLGLAMAGQGRLPEAVAAYEKAIAFNPSYPEAETNLGVALLRMNQNPAALRHLARALALAPGMADAHYNLGLVLAATGRAEDALTHYAEAVRLNPAQVEARLNLGVMQAQGGRLSAALEQLTEAVRLKPGLAEAHANLGIVLAETGRLGEAVTSYEAALRLRPDYALAHYNLGNALVKLQRWPEAKRHFAEAVRLAPDFPAARGMLERLQAVPTEP